MIGLNPLKLEKMSSRPKTCKTEKRHSKALFHVPICWLLLGLQQVVVGLSNTGHFAIRQSVTLDLCGDLGDQFPAWVPLRTKCTTKSFKGDLVLTDEARNAVAAPRSLLECFIEPDRVPTQTLPCKKEAQRDSG